MADQNGTSEASPLLEKSDAVGTDTTDMLTETESVPAGDEDDDNDNSTTYSERRATKKRSKKKKKKSKTLKLTTQTAFQLEREVSKSLAKHNLAAQYLACRHFWIFTVPQAVLTCVSSILAFVSTSDLLTPYHKTICGLIVGSTSGVVVFLQTMSGICNYGARAAMHQGVAIDLRNLRDDLVLLRHKLASLDKQQEKRQKEAQCGLGNTTAAQSSKSDQNDDEDDDDTDDHGTSFDSIRNRYQQSLTACKSVIPMELLESFSGLESNLHIAKSQQNMTHMYGVYGHIDFDDYLETKAYDILAGEILNAYNFPLRLPHSKRVVQRSMERLKFQLVKYQNFWPTDPQQVIEEVV